MRRFFVVAAVLSLALVSCSKKEEAAQAPATAPPKLPVETQQAQPAQKPDNPEEPHFANVTQLTHEGDNGEAYFSWDSKKLIWQSSRGGEECDKIWTMNIDGSEKTMVSPPGGAHTCSYFFPGDEVTIFASTSHLGDECPPRPQVPGKHYVWPLWPYDIFKKIPDGLVNLTESNPEYDAEPIVSRNGNRIVFGSKRMGDFDIYAMNAQGKEVVRLTHEYGYDGGPWWSPDAMKIAYRAWHPKTEEEKAEWADAMENNYIVPVPLQIYVMNADGSGKQQLTDNGATNWAPSWHPDGQRIIFSSNMDDWNEERQMYGHNFELYLINVDGTGLTRLTFNDVFDAFAMISPDGAKIAWASNRNPEKPRATDIYIADWVE